MAAQTLKRGVDTNSNNIWLHIWLDTDTLAMSYLHSTGISASVFSVAARPDGLTGIQMAVRTAGRASCHPALLHTAVPTRAAARVGGCRVFVDRVPHGSISANR
jgi:hypothetical protein